MRYMNFGAKLGIWVGMALSLMGLAGSFGCNWNPVDGTATRLGICSDASVFYFPFAGAQWLFLLIGINFGSFLTLFLFPSIVLIGAFAFIGASLSWLAGHKDVLRAGCIGMVIGGGIFPLIAVIFWMVSNIVPAWREVFFGTTGFDLSNIAFVSMVLAVVGFVGGALFRIIRPKYSYA